MNRVTQSLKSYQQPPASSNLPIESALFAPRLRGGQSALFAPLHYESGYAYPLIVWLHGRDDDERQLMRIMPLVSMRNYVAVAPRGMQVAEQGRAIYGWQQSEDHIQRAEHEVFESIEAARQKYHVARRRIFLAGFDCGGTMAYRVALNHPNRFAGVLSLCGAFPQGHTPFGNLTQARRLPLFLAVGRDSREYPSEAVCEDLRLFHTAGLSITLRQYPCDHELCAQMLADMDRWIIEQITADGRSAAESDPQWLRESD